MKRIEINNSIYPSFNNSVISKRIFSELEIDIEEPYIHIEEIIQNGGDINETESGAEGKVSREVGMESKQLVDESIEQRIIGLEKQQYTLRYLFGVSVIIIFGLLILIFYKFKKKK